MGGAVGYGLLVLGEDESEGLGGVPDDWGVERVGGRIEGPSEGRW